MSKPVVLFVPGAWHGPDCYDPVAVILRAAGYETVGVTLKSVGPQEHLKSFDPDVAAIRAELEPLVNSGKDVVVIAHSYGSMPTNEAIKGLTKQDRTAAGKAGGVVHYVFCSAFMAPVNTSLMDMLQGKDLPWFIVSEDKMLVNPDTPRKIFYNDLSEEDAAKEIAKLKPFSYQTYFSKTTYPAYQHVPTTYIYCTEDMAIPLPVQQLMVQNCGTKVAETTIEGAGHCPMLSQPQKVAEVIAKAAS